MAKRARTRADAAGDPNCCNGSGCDGCYDCGDCESCMASDDCLCDDCPAMMDATAVIVQPRASGSYQHVIRAAMRMPWAILPAKLEEVAALLELKAAGLPTPQYAAQPQRTTNRQGAVAVLPLFGVISQRMGMMSEFSGGTSTERFTQAFRQAVADPDVAAILLDVDSPGGTVPGVDELATEIRSARGKKPIVASVNSLCASAAYWIASATDEITITPSGQLGSIGVFSLHMDASKAIEQAGLKPTLISAGRFKAEGLEEFPFSVEARDYQQSEVNRYYDMFVGAVANGRGVPTATVRGGFGEGRTVGAKDAVAQKMADRVETFDATLNRLMNPNGRAAISRRQSTAAEEWLPPIESKGYSDGLESRRFPPVVIDGSIAAVEAPPSPEPEPPAPQPEDPAPTKRVTEQALRDAGWSAREAKAFVSRGWVATDRDDPPGATTEDESQEHAETTGTVAGPSDLARRRFELERLIHAV